MAYTVQELLIGKISARRSVAKALIGVGNLIGRLSTTSHVTQHWALAVNWPKGELDFETKFIGSLA